MQMTLSLNRRTHLFIKDGKLFFKLYKPSKFTDKKDCAVLSDVPIEQAEAIHKWLGEVIDATKKGDPVTISTPKPDIQHHIDNLLVFTKSKKAVGH